MKREPVGSERDQDTWLRNTLRQSAAAGSDACLDAETLAAWADGGLDAKAAASVELHASNCSRCLAVLATMERTAPAPAVTETWTLARVFRWVAPLAAAATAVAIWVAVPNRSIAPVESTISQVLKSTEAVPVPAPVPGSGSASGVGNQAAAPRTGNAETGARDSQDQTQFRDELRRERVEGQALGSVAAPAAAPNALNSPGGFAPESAPETLAKAEAPPPAAIPAPQTFATDAVAESATAATDQRSAMSLTARSADSTSPSNPLIRWRVVQPVAVERSLDGGKTWTKTTLPAPNVVTIRSVDGDRAVATTSENARFYTTNGGQSWTRVQENSAAPF